MGRLGTLVWRAARTRPVLLSIAVVIGSVTCAAAAPAAASAEPSRAAVDADHPTVAPAPRHRTFGMSMDIGVPDGAALGLSIRPALEWLRIGAAVTHNGMAPGMRFGATLDPVAFPLAPTFTVEGGHYWEGRLPVVKDSPSIGYNYANFHLGLEVGNRATFRFFLRGGVSWVDVSTAHFQSASKSSGGSGIGDPSYNGWLAPSGKLGFAAYF
jgi:hypothetical protein